MSTEQETFEALKYRIEIDREGNKRYFDQRGRFHCEEGPAIVYADGSASYYKHGLRHRLDGPACLWLKDKKWFIDGVELTEEEFNEYRARNF
jgi:hypothetical protein